MNKTELVAAIAKNAELTKKDAEAALTAFTETVAAELKKGEKVQLVGFGTFEVSKRAVYLQDFAVERVLVLLLMSLFKLANLSLKPRFRSMP